MDNVSDITSKAGSSGWHIALAAASGERYLGSLEVVSGVVRHFLASICDRYSAVCDGRSVPWEAANADRDACKQMAAVFCGKDSAYTSMGDWNVGGGLGRYVAKQMEAIIAPKDLADPQAAVEQCFALVAHQAYEILGGATDDASLAAVQDSLSWLADQLSLTLLGRPSGLFDF